MKITVTHVMKVPAFKAFQAWTTASILKQWMSLDDATIEARVGGAFRYAAGAYVGAGTFKEFVQGRRTVQAWTQPVESVVTTDFHPLTKTSVKVDVVEEGAHLENENGRKVSRLNWLAALRSLEAFFV